MPFVSESIWIGKMNHIKKLLGEADADVRQALFNMELSQANETIIKIYERYCYRRFRTMPKSAVWDHTKFNADNTSTRSFFWLERDRMN
jgi:hypothetical protein